MVVALLAACTGVGRKGRNWLDLTVRLRNADIAVVSVTEDPPVVVEPWRRPPGELTVRQ